MAFGNKVQVVLTRRLNTFDVTNLVVGSIIGADIYVAAALGAKLVGPASLLLWVGAGIIAVVIALSFSYCATILPKVGGPYAYIKDVAGPFSGFMVGWSLFLAEWLSLAVFPVAFTKYFLYFFPGLGPQYQILLKAIFIGIILVTNITSIKLAGKFNDYLTIGKLSPLILLMVAGILFLLVKPQVAAHNFYPFIKGNIFSFGKALVLIFWAYAGFELSTLPADEIQEPQKTIPRAILTGVFIVIIFYFITNFVITGIVDGHQLASSQTPLMDAVKRIFSFSRILGIIGILIIGVGALVSITGADESGTIGTSRLAYAMSFDGLLPRVFSRLHKSFQTPYIGLILICTSAFIASIFGSLSSLINASVFLLSFAYLATCIATIFLTRKYPQISGKIKGKLIVPILGAVFSILLMTQVTAQQILVSFILIGIGVPIYIFFSPKHELHELKEAFLSREGILKRAFEQSERFLAYPVRRVKWLIYRIMKIERAFRKIS
jgi:amino acid transporter